MTASLKPKLSVEPSEDKTFGKKWWSNFYEATNSLTRPKVFKNVISEDDIDLLTICTLRVLKFVSQNRIDNGFRVSVGGKMSDENRGFFYNNPIREDEDIEEWSKKVFGDKKFGVILNSCQNYDLGIKSEISSRFKTLLEDFGVPINGIEISLFFGNYGFTPLGFHLDPAGHKVTHLHLGPGSKQMFLINKEKYEKELGAKQGSKDFEKLIQVAEKYEFDKGDIFFMPNSVYHVGNNPELSIGLTIWHIEPCITEFQTKMFLDLTRKLFVKEDNETLIRKDFNDVGDISNITKALEGVIDLDPSYEDLNLKQSLESVILEHRYKLFSNGYFYGFEPRSRFEVGISEEVTLSTIVRGVAPFISYVFESENKTSIFMQGIKIEVPNNNNWAHIILLFNDYKERTVGEIFSCVLDDWDEDLICFIASKLCKTGGIEIVLSKD